MAVLNYTGREDIDRSQVEIVREKDMWPLTVYLKTQQELRDNAKYIGCDVVLVAYLRTKAERAELGSIASLKASVQVVFKEFQISEGVQYRLMVVRPSDKMLTGAVDGLKEKDPKKPKEEHKDRIPLLPVNWATDGDNMGGRFWKIDFKGSKPTLLLQSGKFATLGDVNKLEFKALAFPSILKECLTEAFVTRFDNPPTWAENWETLARILGAEDRPMLSEGEKNRQNIQLYFEGTRDWIDSVAARFAADCKLASIDSEFKQK